jgi:hypothetical protein
VGEKLKSPTLPAQIQTLWLRANIVYYGPRAVQENSGDIRSTIVIAHNRLFVRASNKLYCFSRWISANYDMIDNK